MDHAAGRTPEGQGGDAAAAGAGTRAQGEQCAADVSEDSNDEGQDTGAMYTLQQQQQQRPPLPRALPAQQQQQAKRPASRMQRPVPQPQQVQLQQQQQPGRQLNRVITAYNPQLQQQVQQQVQAQQQQQQMQHMMMQLQHVMMQGQTQQQQGVSEEALQQFYEIGTALGSLMQENGPAALLTNPAAMSAVIETVLQDKTGNPVKAMQQLFASMAAPMGL